MSKPNLVLVTTLLGSLLILAGCTKPESSPLATGWQKIKSQSGDSSVSAVRTSDLDGIGSVTMTLSCNYRPHEQWGSNGFWLTLTMELQGNDKIGLPISLAPSIMGGDDQLDIEVVRSTGESGRASFIAKSATNLFYENNQTNGFDTSNSDPFKVELSQKYAIPLSDERTVWVDTHKEEKGFVETLTDCKRFLPH